MTVHLEIMYAEGIIGVTHFKLVLKKPERQH